MGSVPKRKLSLPLSILKEIDAHQSSFTKGKGRPQRQLSRREHRKAQRVQKRQSRQSQQHQIIEPKKPQLRFASASDVLDDQRENEEEIDSESGSECNGGESTEEQEAGQSQYSKSARVKLSQEDAEIADLERKLGLKRRKFLPKSFEDDGLSDLLGALDEDEEEGVGTKSKDRRKAEADEWLAQKRRKAEAATYAPVSDEFKEDEYSSILNNDFELDDMGEDGKGADSDEFEGCSDEGQSNPSRSQRENPYVAPTAGVAKYIPPSLRKQSSSANEVEPQLRRRVQGLINRLTNDNMIGITKDFMTLYDTYPRQTVTSTMVDLVLALVCSPEKRPDSFFVMIAGFVAAMYKVVGIAISAYFIQQLVEIFGRRYGKASGSQSDSGSKHLISLLAELFNMQVIGCNLIFDYIRMFLGRLSELDTELLLRIVQLCGPSLRRDDPHALGDIVGSIKPASLQNMTVRTSFMIDEMKKLQSNKTKAVTRNRELADQRAQIRKRINTLGSSQDSQPLRISLQDIQDADKHGKWWLVGASWSGGHGNPVYRDMASNSKSNADAADTGDMPKYAEDDLGIPDLWQLAREQGFNTEVRQRIFVALHAATDYENAELLIRKLHLNKHQRKEIPEVIVRSSERQFQYNHYYTLVATRFTGDRELLFQFRRCLTTRLRKMGEDIDLGDGDELGAEEAADYDIRWVYNAGRIYGSLAAGRMLRLSDIVKYRNFAALREKAHMFFEVMFITLLQECERDGLKEIFNDLDVDHARGVQYFLRNNVRKTDLLRDEREKKVVKKNCEVADRVLKTLIT